MIVSISESTDSRLEAFRWRDRQLASSTDRKEKVGAGLFVAEGDLVVDRAVSAGCTPVALLCDEMMATRYASEHPDVTVYSANEDVRREVTGLGVPLRAVGLFQRPPLTSVPALITSSRRLVIAEAIDNPTNLGAIVRSSAALGWDGIILTSGSADPLARRALRVSMGTGLMVPFARLQEFEDLHSLLKNDGFRTFSLTPNIHARDIRSISIKPTDRVAIYLGSERDGLTTSTLQNTDETVRIPMSSSVDSLNVGAAAAIALYALG